MSRPSRSDRGATAALPAFQKRPYSAAREYIAAVLTPPGAATALRELLPQEDGHFRAIFAAAYFTLPEGQPEPSRSQWNTLKKRMKRHDRRVFIFKAHELVTYRGETCGVVDFGFLAE